MLRNQLLWLFYTIRNKHDQRREAKEAAQRAREEQEQAEAETRRREYAEREKTQELLFLALLQTMTKVCEELKPMPWVTYYNGWNPGPAVRALTNENDPIKPIYEIHIEDPHRNNTLSNIVNVEVFQQLPEFEQIYNNMHLFVSNNKLPYLKAVFDLTARRNMSSPERARKLRQLKNMKIKRSQYWNDYPEAHAIEYLESLLQKTK
ncbi:MAG: hypothetical protein J5714_02510 [Alphaproteobacteria bacterium]|nr:hypothetical protein [Alphaproteobacteria bacterium]